MIEHLPLTFEAYNLFKFRKGEQKHKTKWIMKKTKKNYEIMLNEMGSSVCETSFTIKGKKYKGGYGTLLRRHDHITFLIGYMSWIKYE